MMIFFPHQNFIIIFTLTSMLASLGSAASNRNQTYNFDTMVTTGEQFIDLHSISSLKENIVSVMYISGLVISSEKYHILCFNK